MIPSPGHPFVKLQDKGTSKVRTLKSVLKLRNQQVREVKSTFSYMFQLKPHQVTPYSGDSNRLLRLPGAQTVRDGPLVSMRSPPGRMLATHGGR